MAVTQSQAFRLQENATGQSERCEIFQRAIQQIYCVFIYCETENAKKKSSKEWAHKKL